MNSSEDIELDIKQALAGRGEANSISISTETAKQLLARLKEYRQRIGKTAGKFHVRIGKLQSELHRYESLSEMARNRIDPEQRGTQYSQCDKAVVSHYIQEIEKMRGRIITQRMMWGYDPEPDIQNETINTLKEAIKDAQKERRRWYDHLEESRKKMTPLQALTVSTWRKLCACVSSDKNKEE